jgi:hypothetical protein
LAEQDSARAAVFRFGASLAALGAYGLFLLLRFYAPHGYEALLLGWDEMPNAEPYSDLGAILQAGVCWRQGVNVYVASACMHGGLYNYSPFLLRAAAFGLGPWDRGVGGLLIGFVFIAAFSLLPPAGSKAELFHRILAVCSGTVVYALEAANFDTVIYLLVLLGVLLLLKNRLAALCGYAVFLFGAALKFYPVVLLALVIRERFRVILLVGLITLLGCCVYLLHFAAGTATALNMIPGGLPFRGVFGAMNIPYGLLLLRFLPLLTLEPNGAQYFAAVRHPGAAIFVALATRVLTIAALIAAVRTAPRYAKASVALEPRRALFFTAGALAIAFCFFAAQNLDYRGVFLLLTLPGLWGMAGQHRVLWLRIGILLLLWEAFFRELAIKVGTALLGPHAVYLEIIVWLARESLWWWVAIQLSACVLCFLRISLMQATAFRHIKNQHITHFAGFP